MIRRRVLVLLLPVLVLALLLINWRHWRREADNLPTLPANFSPELVEFWTNFSIVLKNAEPPVPLPNGHVEAAISPYNAANSGSYTYRHDLIDLTDEEVELLRSSHTQFVEVARQLAPSLPYKPGTRGIAVTAAGEWVPELLVSLRLLRNSGSELPVEVFFESPLVYEDYICSTILPTLNARCFILSSLLSTSPTKLTMSKYQLKAFTLLFSSFDDVLLLDADNLAVQSPEDLISAEPYRTAGLITWPDYWANTASPLFYTIASISPTPSPGDRASSDSGQVLLSKSKHATTLLLIAYYSFYGPSHYYPLLSQGAVGQGDKETYLAAAMALNTSFYDVKTPIAQLGFRPSGPGVANMALNAPKTRDGRHPSASTQHDPRDEVEIKEGGKVRPAFVHAQTYKLNAGRVVEKWRGEINGRMFGTKEEVEGMFFGRDIEREAWEAVRWTGCELEGRFRDWEDREGVCGNVTEVFEEMFGS